MGYLAGSNADLFLLPHPLSNIYYRVYNAIPCFPLSVLVSEWNNAVMAKEKERALLGNPPADRNYFY